MSNHHLHNYRSSNAGSSGRQSAEGEEENELDRQRALDPMGLYQTPTVETLDASLVAERQQYYYHPKKHSNDNPSLYSTPTKSARSASASKPKQLANDDTPTTSHRHFVSNSTPSSSFSKSSTSTTRSLYAPTSDYTPRRATPSHKNTNNIASTASTNSTSTSLTNTTTPSRRPRSGMTSTPLSHQHRPTLSPHISARSIQRERKSRRHGAQQPPTSTPQYQTLPTAATSNSTTNTTPMTNTNSKSSSSQTPPKLTRPSTASSNRKKAKGRSAASSLQRTPPDFQHPEDMLSVELRHVHVSSRTVFEPMALPTLEEWHKTAAASTPANNPTGKAGGRRISPSLQQLQLLHHFQNIATIRQLAFGPSLGWNADLWTDPNNNNNNNNATMTTTMNAQTQPRDGRYRSIHPLEATLARLPSKAPLLSNKKYRLPMRSDVGFPNSSPEEIQIKQEEVRWETQWEEASPRLIVLMTSDRLGNINTTNDNGGNNNAGKVTEELERENSNNDRNGRSFHTRWDGVPLEGIPYAGKELWMVKQRNQEHFGNVKKQSPTRERSHQDHRHRGNPTSVLAPPLGATYSASLGWRPRPFHDRPAAHEYGLACPLQVNVDAGHVEPLICSMALYTLPIFASDSQSPFGKTSEEFYFPAGVWDGKVDFDAAKDTDGTLNVAILKTWHARKHKALFCYDPLVLKSHHRRGKENNGGCDGDATLHLVVQVYRLTDHVGWDEDSSTHSETSSSDKKKKGLGRRIKSKLGKIGKTGGGSNVGDKPSDSTEKFSSTLSADQMFEQFGTQLLTPYCFGVVPFCPNQVYAEGGDGMKSEKMKWPAGTKQTMQLFPSATLPESQDHFIDRLVSVMAEERQKSPNFQDLSHPEDALAADGDIPKQSDSPDDLIQPKKRLFKPKAIRATSRTSSVNSTALESVADEMSAAMTRVSGTASIFTSHLGADFTRSLLVEPLDFGNNETNKDLPRLLVDPSGDCAITINPSSTDGLSPPSGLSSDPKKRSDLVRLAQTPTPSGYAGASEIRETQYLPPRQTKQYDVDTPTSFRSIQNVLYMYPKLLKFANLECLASQQKCTLRFRLIQASHRTDDHEDDANEDPEEVPLEMFYSPSPWSGPPMQRAYFTKISAGWCPTKDGVAFHDEIKLRLPLVIDGSYFLEFSLCSVAAGAGGVELNVIAETMIPLSSSSTREASSGVKVTTIIPNGSHRLKLGEHQFQFETRLVSTIHIADPTTALVLRDFPLLKNKNSNFENDDRYRALALVPSRSIVGRSDTSGPIVDLKVPYQQLFASASQSTLLGQLPLLLHMHLSNLVNHSKRDIYVSTFTAGNDTDDGNGQPLVETIRSLCEILGRLKDFLWSRSCNVEVIDSFIKDLVDSFDEQTLLHDSKAKVPDEQRDEFVHTPRIPFEKSRSESSNIERSQGHSAMLEDIIDDDRDDLNGSGGGYRHKDSVRAEIDLRISRTASKINADGVPFARVAFGATLTDRMKAEAELYQEGQLTHLFEDDETVATTIVSPHDRRSMGDYVAAWAAIDEEVSLAGNTIASIDSPRKPKAPREKDNPPLENTFARRVRTAAQVIIAPCITPVMSQLFVPGSLGSPVKVKFDQGKKKADPLTTKKLGSELNGFKHSVDDFAIDGSDVENEKDTPDSREEGVKKSTTTVYRGETECVLFQFSYGHEAEPNDRPFAYEPILALWLKAWLDRQENDSNGSPVLPFEDGGDKEDAVLMFYSHIDVFLPLCLKSIVLRCSPLIPPNSTNAKAIFDQNHMEILFPLVGAISASILGAATSGEDRENCLISSLTTMDTLMDFLIGLASIVHPQQLAELLQYIFDVLRRSETLQSETPFVWGTEAIRRVTCSRQIRLRAVERLSTVGSFVALNFPCKYQTWKARPAVSQRSWIAQGNSESPAGKDARAKNSKVERLPRPGWLAELVLHESLWICSLSCEVVVAEAMASIEMANDSPMSRLSNLDGRPGKSLTKTDLLSFESTAVHAVTCVHELVIRRHALDVRFQTERCRSRIAALFAKVMLEKSISSVRWLARTDSTHKVRSLWLVCLAHVLQEAPEAVLRSSFVSYCQPPDFTIHRLLRLLRLCSSTFQALLDGPIEPSVSVDTQLSPWLLQESFNSVCSSIIMIIGECTPAISPYRNEMRAFAQGSLDLLLHILTVPQSAVTHLRTVGGALHALDRFGVETFLGVSGESFQHWIRIMLTLMNSISLSVRSIAVDFVISLLSDTFVSRGTIDDITIVSATVLPQVVAREIALYSVEGLVNNFHEIERVIWPLRRSLADIEGANPLDDSRIDPQLSPLLSVFCRSCQAIIDGVALELKLNPRITIVGTELHAPNASSRLFDADEESLFEAASFFSSEGSPLQRLRWLRTLKMLHESKGQWVEAAETLMLCGRTVADSLPHLRHVWMPSEFVLWNDPRRSLWLGTIGKEMGVPDRGNQQVMEFASAFLQPKTIFGQPVAQQQQQQQQHQHNDKVAHPSFVSMCRMLVSIVRESINIYAKEEGTDQLAFNRLESLLHVLTVVIEEHAKKLRDRTIVLSPATRKVLAEEVAALRQASAYLNSDLNKLAEKLLLVSRFEGTKPSPGQGIPNPDDEILRRQFFVRVKLSGSKLDRFNDSTLLPTYLEWNTASICRVPRHVIETVLQNSPCRIGKHTSLYDQICEEYGKPLRDALTTDKANSPVFRFGGTIEEKDISEEDSTFLDVSLVHTDLVSIGQRRHGIMDNQHHPQGTLESKRFFFRKTTTSVFDRGSTSNLVELTVARPFPCPLSRQRVLITSEFVESSA